MVTRAPSTAASRPTFRVSSDAFGPRLTLVAVSGELDLAPAPALREHLDAALAAGVRGIVIDLTAVTFIDSIALAAVANARQRLGRRGRLALAVGPESYANLILAASGLNTVLECFEDRHEAMGALAA
jgi:anti-sigma B factor antagonist